MISIVIPVLNEADTIGKLLSHLKDNSDPKNISEIIIVDGGSTDGTREILKRLITSSNSEYSKLFRVLFSKKGRAFQMNTGAKQATGSILYFLHADSLPPKEFDELIINEVANGNLADRKSVV